MSYGFIPFQTEKERENVAREPYKPRKQLIPDEFGYEFVRVGESSEVALNHKEHTQDIAVLVDYYISHGYSDRLPRLDSLEFLRHVKKFRAMLDAWELIPIDKVFTKDEIYIRCLQEGPAYLEFIKKCRNTTLRALTSETSTDVEEEYFYPVGYKGYDSIIHERNLIHWDDRDTVVDIEYAFMEPPPDRLDFAETFKSFLESMSISRDDFETDINQLSELKNTKMMDPSSGKTHLMREYFCDELDLSQPFMAKRCIVLTEPASTRDTGVGDPSTVAKVKCINKICRTILERCKYSASASSDLSTSRLMRVLERNCYLHLDFKKYGLAFVRYLQNVALHSIGLTYDIDMEDLLISNFYVQIEDELYETSRGTMLGWVDCLNELCVHAILYSLTKKGIEIDWIAFNDDVEISFRNPEISYREKAEMIRDLVLAEFDSYGILISITKTYASRASCFLEKYFRFDKYNLDMEKRQLAVRPYARSMVTKEPWLAKIWFAAGYSVWPNDEIASRCIGSSKVEFHEDERSASLFNGGWYPNTNTIDVSRGEDPQHLRNLGVELTRIQLPDISSKPASVGSTTQIYEAKVKLISNAKDSYLGRIKFEMDKTVFDVNFEASGGLDLIQIRCREYVGRDENFVLAYRSAMNGLVAREVGRKEPKDNP